MSLAGQQAFAALSEYFLNRAREKSRAQYQAAEYDRQRALKKQDREEEEASKPPERKPVTRYNGGQAMSVDVETYYNPETKKREERIYGAIPIATEAPKQNEWRRGSDGVAYRTGADGNLETDTSMRRPDKGAKGAKTTEPKAPKRIWVVDGEGNEVLRSEDEVAAGGYRPAPRDAAGRRALAGQQSSQAWRKKAGEVAGSIASGLGAVTDSLGNTVSSVFTGGSRQAPAQPERAGQGAQVSPEDAQIISEARERIKGDNPFARKAIEDYLRAKGKANLIPLL